MIVRWSGAAADDLRDAQAYVEEFDPGAAGRMVARIVLTANKMLAQYPEIGRPGRVSGTRELIIAKTPYIVPYRIADGRVEILRVFHSARKWPARF